MSFFFDSSFVSFKELPTIRKMAGSFTRMIGGRNGAVLLASLGAGTMATGFLMSDNPLAAEVRTKLYPPR